MGSGGGLGFDVHELVGLRLQTGYGGSLTARGIHAGCARDARAPAPWADHDHRPKPCPRRSGMSYRAMPPASNLLRLVAFAVPAGLLLAAVQPVMGAATGSVGPAWAAQ